MSGLIEAARAAARRFSFGVRQLGRAPSPRRLRNWLIPPSASRGGGNSLPGGSRFAIVRVPVLVPVPVPSTARRPHCPAARYSGEGTSRPLAASVWWSAPAPATLDSTVFGAPIAPIHAWPRRVFMLTAAVGALLFGSATALAQCCGSGCGGGGCSPGCGSPGFGSFGFGSPAPNCCCPSGGCGFGCSAGCGCPRAPFGLSLFGGGRCCPPCGSCCGSPCGGGCGSCGGCGPVCGRCCSPPCGAPCGMPCGGSCGGPCGCAPCGGAFCGSPVCGSPFCGSPCGGPPCGMACGPSYGPSCGPSCGPVCGPSCGPAACGAGCGACCLGAPAPGGDGCCPTFETNPALPPGAINRPGYPPAGPLGDPIPGVAPTTIPKRQPPPDDKGTRFERRPPETSNTAAATDLTQNAEPSELPVPRPSQRLFRQSVSAGFHTHVLTARSGRLPGESVAARTAPRPPRREEQLARTE
jgi:hypothetical protein